MNETLTSPCGDMQLGFLSPSQLFLNTNKTGNRLRHAIDQYLYRGKEESKTGKREKFSHDAFSKEAS